MDRLPISLSAKKKMNFNIKTVMIISAVAMLSADIQAMPVDSDTEDNCCTAMMRRMWPRHRSSTTSTYRASDVTADQMERGDSAGLLNKFSTAKRIELTSFPNLTEKALEDHEERLAQSEAVDKPKVVADMDEPLSDVQWGQFVPVGSDYSHLTNDPGYNSELRHRLRHPSAQIAQPEETEEIGEQRGPMPRTRSFFPLGGNAPKAVPLASSTSGSGYFGQYHGLESSEERSRGPSYTSLSGFHIPPLQVINAKGDADNVSAESGSASEDGNYVKELDAMGQ